MKLIETAREIWKQYQGLVVLSVLVILAAITVGVFHYRKPALRSSVQPMATTNPQKVGLFVSTDGTGRPGTWVAMTGLGTPFSGSVQPVGMAVSIDGTGNPGTWAAATSTTFAPAGSPITGPGAAGPSLTGFFHDYVDANAGVGCLTIGSPSGGNNCAYGDNNDPQAASHPGILTLTTGTVSGAGMAAFSGTNGGVAQGRTLAGLNQGVWYYESEVKIPVLPSTTPGNYEQGSTNNSATGSIPWTSIQASFLLSSADAVVNDWYCGWNNVHTDSGVAATTNWVRLGIYADGTYVHFYINGVEATGCRSTEGSVFSGNYYWSEGATAGSTTSVIKYIDYDSFYQVVSR